MPITVECLGCGTSLRIKPSVLKRGRGRFCSRLCAGAWKSRQNQVLTCLACGREFIRTPSEMFYGKTKYCSRACVGPGNRHTPKQIEAGFWAAIQKTDDCWIWTKTRTKAGYGVYRARYAHRLSYEKHHGPIPDGLHVCHTCDNPACVRPDHLFLGTAKDNRDDMVQKGRAPNLKGENHGKAKLTEDNVREIRRLYGRKKQRPTQTELAERYCVTRSAIREIVTGRNWSHLL